MGFTGAGKVEFGGIPAKVRWLERSGGESGRKMVCINGGHAH